MSRLRYGRWDEVECQADLILFPLLAGISSRHEKSDIITPWKEVKISQREVLCATISQPSKGLSYRVANIAKAGKRWDPGATKVPRGAGTITIEAWRRGEGEVRPGLNMAAHSYPGRKLRERMRDHDGSTSYGRRS